LVCAAVLVQRAPGLLEHGPGERGTAAERDDRENGECGTERAARSRNRRVHVVMMRGIKAVLVIVHDRLGGRRFACAVRPFGTGDRGAASANPLIEQGLV